MTANDSGVALGAALEEFLATDLPVIRHELAGATRTHTFDAIPRLRSLLLLEAPTADSDHDHNRLLEQIIKELARIVIEVVSKVAMDPENIQGFVHLDDNVWPLLSLMDALGDRWTAQSMEDIDRLLRWTPFVMYSSAFFLCGRLPAFDAMKSTEIASSLLANCQTLHQKTTPSALLAVAVDRLVALASQGGSKETWVAEHSLPKHVLEWIVVQVPFPHLGGEVLGRLLALVFPLIDDLTDTTQLVGATMLRHIVQNVTDTELRWYGDVLLEVLRPAITSRKPATLDPLLASLVVALDKLSPPGDRQYYDRFVPRLLSDWSLASDVELRVLYTRHMRAVIARLGAPRSLHLIRFLQPLLKVLYASMDSVNAPLVLETLETLRATVLGAWPRIPPHAEMIFTAVIKAVALCECFHEDMGLQQLPSASDKARILALGKEIVLLLRDLTQSRACIGPWLERVVAASPQMGGFCRELQGQLT